MSHLPVLPQLDDAVLRETHWLSELISQSLEILHLRFPEFEFYADEVDEDGRLSFTWKVREEGPS